MATIRALTAVLLLCATCATAANSVVLGFFGQNPSADTSLKAMCDGGIYTMIGVSFVNTYGYLPLHIDLGQYSCDVPLAAGSGLSTSGCAGIADDIAYCRSIGVKVLLAMGGCVDASCGGNYGFQTVQQANDTADSVWSTYLAPNSNASAVAGSTERPFGSAVFDGVILDVENETPADNPDQPFYEFFVRQLQSYDSSLLIVGTPTCPTTYNAMQTMTTVVPFSHLMVQFYNDPDCALGKSGFDASLAYWMGLNNSATQSMQILIGAPGDTAAYNKKSGAKLFSGGQLGALVNQYRNDSARNPVTGVGIWAAQDDHTLLSALNDKLATPWETSSAVSFVSLDSITALALSISAVLIASIASVY